MLLSYLSFCIRICNVIFLSHPTLVYYSPRQLYRSVNQFCSYILVRRVLKFHLLNCYNAAHLSFPLHMHFLYLSLMYPKFYHIVYYYRDTENESFYDIDLLFLSVFLISTIL